MWGVAVVCCAETRMHATGHTDRSGGGGGSWRLPPDETLQVADPKDKEEVRQYMLYH